MLITDLSKLSQLPSPGLGLLNAIHTSTVTPMSSVLVNGVLPSNPSASNLVLRNDTANVVILPASGNYPDRPLYPNEYAGTNPWLYYKVINKKGNSRAVFNVSDGVFTAINLENGIANGQLAKVAGFVNPIGFFNDSDYTIANIDGNTFQLKDSNGDLITNASAAVAGWIHTYSTNSYYPAHFERIAYSASFTGASLKAGSLFTLSRAFTFRAVAANTAVVWNVIFEFGQRRNKTSPAPIGPNIQQYEFLPPAIDQQVVLTDLTTTHNFGLTFQKTGDPENFITGSRLLYSSATKIIPGTTPTQDDFILRVRLGNFDIQDDVTDLSGYVGYVITDPILK